MAPRDYKQRQARAPAAAKKRPISAWIVFSVGVMVGVVGTIAVFVYEPRVSVPGLASNDNARETKAPVLPRFEFYTVLPEKEIAITETALVETANRSPEPLKSAATGTRYLLQVGSFRKLQDADRLKAQLVILGLEAAIQTVSIDGTETWHRVRVGPYGQIAKLKAARSRLKQNRFESIVLKLRN